MVELLVVVGLIGGVVVAHEIGFWLGGLVRRTDEVFDRQVALIRNSTTALVAFLIAFAFSGAGSRYVDRLDIIVKEANALGTAYLRSDTIAEPERGDLKAALREYTSDRVELLSGERRDRIDPLLDKVNGLHERMWRAAIKATQGNAPLMAVVLPPVNEVIDLHSTHLSVVRRHLPLPILAVLLAATAVAFGLVGIRQWTDRPAIFAAQLGLWSRARNRALDGDRPRLSGLRHHSREQSHFRGDPGHHEVRWRTDPGQAHLPGSLLGFELERDHARQDRVNSPGRFCRCLTRPTTRFSRRAADGSVKYWGRMARPKRNSNS